jgi:heme-degrading monooxygenase HmoA
MFARVGIFQSTPERVDDDEARRAREQMLQTLQRLPGFAGLYVLGDRQTGKTMGISLWETEAALHAWEEMRADIVRNRAAAAGHVEQEGASYEVVFSSRTEPTSRQALLGGVSQ